MDTEPRHAVDQYSSLDGLRVLQEAADGICAGEDLGGGGV
eukprot:CAMPEP_0173246644 /NCGR_PEP_ID=MMETSP1142-20121109/17441_1 /TAXON_ID=483371 /ORGANISM="non described non described, Strain CCMP2298" /LENGTH=39 /DNA_ID= /DNA_START= /DNA_END= /DNA_ORIENTATION=